MTKEQAIERLNRIITTKFNNDYSIDNIDKEAIETILNLIQKQKEEIEKKDKQIDLMAEYIDFDKMNFECSSLCVKDNCQKECIKQYFERKVENEN